MRRLCISNGATIIFFSPGYPAKPVRVLKTIATSSVNFGSLVSKLKSV
jgi:hypothetical protein